MNRNLRNTACSLCLTLALVPAGARAETGPLQALIGADSDLRVSGSVRLRDETVDGQARAGLNPTDRQLALRTTLSVEYHHGALKLGAEVDDSRAWLGKPGSAISANDVDTFEPVQAYAALDIPGLLGAGSHATLTGGRFTLNLASRRFIASDDYRNVTSSYTGLRADLKGRGGATAL